MTNRSIMLFALLAVATVAHAAPQPSIALPADLARVLRDYEAAWSTMNTTSLSRLFAEDGFVLSNGHEPVRGRAAIEAFYRGQGGPLSLRLRSQPTDRSGTSSAGLRRSPGNPISASSH